MASQTIEQKIEILVEGQEKLKELVKDNQKYQKSANETEKSNKDIAQSFFFVANSAKMIVSGMKQALNTINEYIGAADKVGKAAQRLGVSLEFYQKLESAAGHAGTSINAFTAANRKMLMNLQSLQEGSKKTTRVFQELGVSVKNNDGTFRNQEELLVDTLKALADMEDVTQRNSLAMETLGRSATELNPLLNEGSEAIQKYIDGNESAVMVSEDMAKASQRYNDALLTISETFKKDFNEALTPAVEGMADLLEYLVQSGAVDDFAQAISELVKPLSIMGKMAKTAWQALTGGDTAGANRAIKEIEEMQKKYRSINTLAEIRKVATKDEIKEYSKLSRLLAMNEKSINAINAQDKISVDDKVKLIALEKLRDGILNRQKTLNSDIYQLEQQYNASLFIGLKYEKEREALKRKGSTSGTTTTPTVTPTTPADDVKEAIIQIGGVYDETSAFIAQRDREIANSQEAWLKRKLELEKKIAKRKEEDKLKEEEATKKARLEERKTYNLKMGMIQDVGKMGIAMINDNAMASWLASSALASADAIGAIISTIRDVKGGLTSKLGAASIITGVTTGLIGQMASTRPKKAYNGIEIPSDGRSGDTQMVAVRSGERVLTPSQNRAYKVNENRISNNNSVSNNVTINADFKGSDMAEIQRVLPDLVARGIEQADRENKIDYSRLSNFNLAVAGI